MAVLYVGWTEFNLEVHFTREKVLIGWSYLVHQHRFAHNLFPVSHRRSLVKLITDIKNTHQNASRFDATQCFHWLINGQRIPFPRYTVCAGRCSFHRWRGCFILRTNVFQLSWSNPLSIVFMYCLALPELHWLPVCREVYKHKSDLFEILHCRKKLLQQTAEMASFFFSCCLKWISVPTMFSKTCGTAQSCCFMFISHTVDWKKLISNLYNRRHLSAIFS